MASIFDHEKFLFIGSTLLSAYVAGHIGAHSRVAIPTILLARDDLTALRQFATMYGAGIRTAPPLAALSAACTFAAAFLTRGWSTPRRTGLLVAAGLATAAIGPWTFAIMLPTNNALFGRLERLEEQVKEKGSENGVGVGRSEEVDGLLKRWSLLNWCRSALPIVGCLLAVEAM